MKELRERIENLLLGTYGVTCTMATGRFSLAIDTTPETQPSNALERFVWVTVAPRAELQPTNRLDGMGLFSYPCEIAITYLYAPNGTLLDDATDTSGTPAGSDKRAVYDRVNADIHQIQTVVEWQENWSGTNPTIFNIAPEPEGELEFIPENSRAILKLKYNIWVQQDFSNT